MSHGCLERNTSQTIHPIPLFSATLSLPTPPPSLPSWSHLRGQYPSAKQETETLKNELSKRKWEFISTLPPTAPTQSVIKSCLFQSQLLDTHCSSWFWVCECECVYVGWGVIGTGLSVRSHWHCFHLSIPPSVQQSTQGLVVGSLEPKWISGQRKDMTTKGDLGTQSSQERTSLCV